MSIITNGHIINADTITISGHTDVATDLWDGIRNPANNARDIKVRIRGKKGASDVDHVFSNVQSGDTIPVNINRVYETGTNAMTIEVFTLD